MLMLGILPRYFGEFSANYNCLVKRSFIVAFIKRNSLLGKAQRRGVVAILSLGLINIKRISKQ